jgi:hypothetical protein
MLWKKALAEMRKTACHICPYAQQAQSVACAGDVFELRFGAEAETAADFLKQTKAQETVSQALTREAGRPLSVKVIVTRPALHQSEGPDIAGIFGAENIEIIEEE